MIKQTIPRYRLASILAVVTAVGVASAWVVPLGLAQAEKPVQATTPVSNEFTEPPLELVLHVEGQTHDVRLDQPLKIKVKEHDLNVMVSAKPYRTFRAAGLEFRYPRHFAFQVERSAPNVTIWSLDGNDTVVMVLKSRAPMNPNEWRDSLIEATRSQFDPKDTRVSETALNLGGRAVSGRCLEFRVASTVIRQEYFALSRAEAPVLLSIQHPVEEDQESGSEVEYRQTKELLEASFRLMP